MTQTRSLKLFLIIAFCLTTIIYLLGLNGVFVYDDRAQIIAAKKLHNIFNIRDVIFCDIRQNRVLQNISIAFNWTISNGETWSFKLFNLTLHLINGSLLYAWLKKIFSDKPYLPILATSFFLIHPLQIQSVTYAMGVIMLLYGFFNLLVLNWYTKHKLNHFPMLLFLLIFSLLARETCTLFPVVLLIYELWINKTSIKNIPKLKWSIIFCTPFLFFILNSALSDPGKSMYSGAGGFDLYPFWTHLASQLYFQTFYLMAFINPNLQSIFHGNPNFGTLEIIGALVGGLIWITGGLFLILKHKKYPRAAFLTFLFFINYLQANSLLQMINPFAEYRLYFSNFILCVLLAYLIYELTAWISKKTKAKLNEITIPAILFSFFAIYTTQNVMIWKNWELIFDQAIKRYPRCDLTYVNIGIHYLNARDPKNAIINFQQARALSGVLSAELINNYYLAAVLFNDEGNYIKAWEIVQKIEMETKKYQLPAVFETFKHNLEEKMKSLNISTVNSWDQEKEIINFLKNRAANKP